MIVIHQLIRHLRFRLQSSRTINLKYAIAFLQRLRFIVDLCIILLNLRCHHGMIIRYRYAEW